MARFVSFPGTAGSYASTDDVNLLDADTAHVFQSVGLWEARENTLTSPDAVGTFSPKALRATATSTANSEIRTGGFGVPDIFINPSTNYVYTLQYRAPVGTPDLVLIARTFDAADGSIGVHSVTVAASTETFQTGTLAFTTAALVAKVKIEVRQPSPTAADWFEITDVMLRSGTDSSFLPSLRIVGDLDMRADLQATDWAQGADQYLIGRWGAVDADRSFTFRSRSTDLRFGYNLGAGALFSIFTRTWGDTDRVSLKVTRDATTGDHILSVDGAPVETIGAAPGALQVSTTRELEVGANAGSSGGSNPFAGDYYAASIRDGIDGPIVAVFDPDDITI